MHSRGHGWQHRYAPAEVVAFTGVKAHCLSRVTGERDGGETRRTAGICVLTGSKQSGRTNRARGRACVRRKNDEDGRRVARPPAQGRRRSQLRAEQHAGASLFRDTRDRAQFGNCYESFLRDSANARFAKGGETDDGLWTRSKNDPRKPHQDKVAAPGFCQNCRSFNGVWDRATRLKLGWCCAIRENIEEVSRANFHFEPVRWIWYLLKKFFRNLNSTNVGLFISENDRRNNYHIINGIVATLAVHERSIGVIDARKVALKYFVS